MKNWDIAAIGELIVDLAEVNIDGKAYFAKNAGGAPANMLATASKLGKSTCLIGAVGKDAFGDFLISSVENSGVDVSGVVRSDYPSTFGFVSLDERGERSFDFHRKNTADTMIDFEDVNKSIIAGCRVFHFGTVMMTDERCRETSKKAVEYAKSKGKIISFDPNYRAMLWKSREEAVKCMDEMLSFADTVKISDNEIEMITGSSDFFDGAGYVLSKGAKYVFVTLGKDGCIYASKDGSTGYIKGFDVDSVDTTGAGDTFTGAAVSKLLDFDFNPGKAELEEIVRFSNAAGALNTTKYGAISGIPEEYEIIELIYGKEQPNRI